MCMYLHRNPTTKRTKHPAMVGRRYARKEDNTIYLLNIMTEKECVQKKDEPKEAKEAKFIFMTADEPYDALVWAVSLRVSLRVSSRVSLRVSLRVSSRVPNRVSRARARIPDRIPDRIRDRIPRRIPRRHRPSRARGLPLRMKMSLPLPSLPQE